MKLRTKVKRLKAENERLKQQIFEPGRLVKQDRNVVCLRANARVNNCEMYQFDSTNYEPTVLFRLRHKLLDAALDFIHIEKQENIDRGCVDYMAELYIVQHEEV